jgi:hypothetical protein
VTAAFPVSVPGRLPHQTFRGLLGVHSRYGLLARGAAWTALCIRSFGSIVTSTAVPIATGWNDSCRVGVAPTEDRRLCTAHTDTGFRPVRRANAGLACSPWSKSFVPWWCSATVAAENLAMR